MKNFLAKFLAVFFVFSSAVYAKENQQFPNVSGQVLFQVQADRVMSTQRTGVFANNGFVYVEPNISLNFNKNWSIKTNWRLQPNNTLTTRNSTYPERYRTFLQSGRGLDSQNNGLLIEELKLHFENEDLQVFAGKFDPTFGSVYKKSKRIGVFTSQFGEDYNLREKIGVGGVALLEDSKISINSFFNDTTGLSRSALDDRGRAPQDDGIAGNTGTLSSYSVAIDGKNFFGVDDWYYNAGYRSLGTKLNGRSREKGYVFGTEYAYPIGYQTTLVPFMEVAKISNFAGEQGRDAIYTTLALIGKYSSWSASVSHLLRNIKQQQRTSDVKDRQLQLSVGYKISDNFTIDVSRSELKEDGSKATLLGAVLTYIYQF